MIRGYFRFRFRFRVDKLSKTTLLDREVKIPSPHFDFPVTPSSDLPLPSLKSFLKLINENFGEHGEPKICINNRLAQTIRKIFLDPS